MCIRDRTTPVPGISTTTSEVSRNSALNMAGSFLVRLNVEVTGAVHLYRVASSDPKGARSTAGLGSLELIGDGVV